jgi:hypothetical protein
MNDEASCSATPIIVTVGNTHVFCHGAYFVMYR